MASAPDLERSASPTAQGNPAAALMKAKRFAEDDSPGTAGDPKSDGVGAPPSQFTITEKLFFEFEPRSATTSEPCLLGCLASTVTSIRKPLRGSGAKKKLSIGLEFMYNGLSMFRFAQRAIRLYNDTLGQAGSLLSDASKTHMKKAFEDLWSSLGEKLEPGQVQSIQGLDALVAAIEEKSALRISASKANIKAKSVFFDDFGEIYKPGTKVISSGIAGSGLLTGFTVLWSKYEQGRVLTGKTARIFVICLECWISVGRHFMPVVFTDKNYGYQKRRPLSELFFQPLDVDGLLSPETYTVSDDVALLSSLRERGKTYNRFAVGMHYLEYGSGCFTPHRLGSSALPPSASKNKGRVIIDTEWGSLNHCIARGIHEECRGQILSCHSTYKNWVRDSKNDSNFGQKLNVSSVIKTSTGTLIYKNIPQGLKFASWPLVAGFSFSVKSWGLVVVGEPALTEITFNSKAFDQLVLPETRKRLIKAVVEYTSTSDVSGSPSNRAYSDIIKGKGEGSVFLFYGPPGVGKTLTAEAIAEMLHKPLYQVSMGDLGTTPAELEKGLKSALEMCARWDSLVLLDEADIFVEKRSSSSGIIRNAMVSVMLKMIEYFQGTLFLTTNRVTTFDPAFQTRITAALRYEPLDEAGRVRVWENLLDASGLSGDLKSAEKGGNIDPKELGKYPLNGRVIKNALRLSLALVISEANGGKSSDEENRDSKDWRLTQEVLVETIKMCLEFNSELTSATDLSP